MVIFLNIHENRMCKCDETVKCVFFLKASTFVSRHVPVCTSASSGALFEGRKCHSVRESQVVIVCIYILRKDFEIKFH